MTAQIINIDPEIEAAIHAGQLTKIDITKARMSLANGVFTINAKDILPPKPKAAADDEAPKSGKERQQAFTQRKKEAGFKKDWLHQSVAALADEIGSQEGIAAEFERLRARIEEVEKMVTAEKQRTEEAEAQVLRLKARRWWQFWR